MKRLVIIGGPDGFKQCRKFVLKRWSIQCDYWENFLVSNDYDLILKHFVVEKRIGSRVKIFERVFDGRRKVGEKCLRK